MMELSNQCESALNGMFESYQNLGHAYFKEETIKKSDALNVKYARPVTRHLTIFKACIEAFNEVQRILISRFKKGCDKSQKEFSKRMLDVEQQNEFVMQFF